MLLTCVGADAMATGLSGFTRVGGGATGMVTRLAIFSADEEASA